LTHVYNRVFQNSEIVGIKAGWALADKVKLDPLRQLGMEVRATGMGKKFVPEPDGTFGEFERCELKITREQWAARLKK